MDAIAKQYLVGPFDVWCIATRVSTGTIDLGIYIAAGKDGKIITQSLEAVLLHEPMSPSWGVWLAGGEPGVWLLPPGYYRYRVERTGHEEPGLAFDWFTYRELDVFTRAVDWAWCEMPFEPPRHGLGTLPVVHKPTYASGVEVDQIQAELTIIEYTLASLLDVWRALQAQREQWLLQWHSRNGELPPEMRRAYPGALKT